MMARTGACRCAAGPLAEPVIVAGVALPTAWLRFTRGGRVLAHSPPLLHWIV